MIDSEGFLSKDLDKYESQITRKYLTIVHFYKEINVFGQNLAFRLEAKNDKIEHLCLVALYLRVLSNYQAIYLINIKGIIAEASILLRTLLELQFIIVSIERDVMGKFFFSAVLKNWLF